MMVGVRAGAEVTAFPPARFYRRSEACLKIRIIKHEAVPDCGSYEVRFPDGRPSKYFYFENLPGC